MPLAIYRHEFEAGLAEKITSSASIAFCNQILPVRDDELHETIVKASLELFGREIQREGLYPVQSVLVSTVWNLNDDVFEPAEVWAARHSPVDRPTNLNHDEKIIVGHITGNVPIDTSGNIIGEDTVVEDLPALFHLLNNSVIYTVYSDKERAALIDLLVSSIDNGKKCVSMECLFKNFDYAIIKPNGEQAVLPRNETSSFLTKHLRIYGGTGKYQDHVVGRILRGITFVGKGFVDTPANPASIIIPNESTITFSTKAVLTDLGVLSIQSESKNKENEMTVEELQKQVADLQKANDEQKSVAEKLAKENKVALDAANAKVTELEGVKTANEKTLSEVNAELTKAQLEKTKANRVALLVDGGVAKDVAEKKVLSFLTLSDEQFKEVADTLLEAAKQLKNKNKSEAELKAELDLEAAKAKAEKEGTNPPPTNTEEDAANSLKKTQASISDLFAKTFASRKNKTQKENK